MLRNGRLAGRREDRDGCRVRCQGHVRIGACAGSPEAPALRSRLASRQDIRHKIPALILPYARVLSFGPFASVSRCPPYLRLAANFRTYWYRQNPAVSTRSRVDAPGGLVAGAKLRRATPPLPVRIHLYDRLQSML